MSRDSSHFLELLKPDYNDALKYCRALCAGWSADDARDVLQQSLLKGLESFGFLKDEDKFRSWFFKIITREFYNSVRKHFWKRFLPLETNSYVSEMPDVFNMIENNEKKLLLSKALSKLSVKERSAVLLYEIGDFSIEEIMNVQNENSLSAVKSRLSRARKKLKNIIERLERNKTVNFNKKNLTLIGDLEHETIRIIAESESGR